MYLPVINKQLKNFREAWNVHQIRSAKSKTPTQLWLDGMLQNRHSNYTAVTEVFTNEEVLQQKIQDYIQEHPELGAEAAPNEDIVEMTNLSDLQLAELNTIQASDLPDCQKYIKCRDKITSFVQN